MLLLLYLYYPSTFLLLCLYSSSTFHLLTLNFSSSQQMGGVVMFDLK